MQNNIAIKYHRSCSSRVTFFNEHEIEFDEHCGLKISKGSAEAVIKIVEDYTDIIVEKALIRMDEQSAVELLRRVGFDMDVIAALAGKEAA